MNTKKLHIANQSSLRAHLLVFLFEKTKPIYRSIFKRNSVAWKTTRKDLLRFPYGTLGRSLGEFLLQNDFEVEPKLESHDVSHVLLNYSTDVVSEICLQYFYLGSGKKSLYSFGTVLLGGLMMPEYFNYFLIAFKRGRTALNFSKWNFEHLLKEKTDNLRKLIFKKQSNNKLFI